MLVMSLVGRVLSTGNACRALAPDKLSGTVLRQLDQTVVMGTDFGLAVRQCLVCDENGAC